MRIEHTQDVERAVGLGARWLAECAARDFGLETSLDDLIADLKGWLQEVPGTLILALDPDPVGFCALFIYPNHLHGGRKIAIEKYWYGAGVPLFREAKRWAREQGCSHLLMSASWLMPQSHERVCRFCTDMGMMPFETSFICEVEDVGTVQ